MGEDDKWTCFTFSIGPRFPRSHSERQPETIDLEFDNSNPFSIVEIAREEFLSREKKPCMKKHKHIKPILQWCGEHFHPVAKNFMNSESYNEGIVFSGVYVFFFLSSSPVE